MLQFEGWVGTETPARQYFLNISHSFRWRPNTEVQSPRIVGGSTQRRSLSIRPPGSPRSGWGQRALGTTICRPVLAASPPWGSQAAGIEAGPSCPAVPHYAPGLALL